MTNGNNDSVSREPAVSLSHLPSPFSLAGGFLGRGDALRIIYASSLFLCERARTGLVNIASKAFGRTGLIFFPKALALRRQPVGADRIDGPPSKSERRE